MNKKMWDDRQLDDLFRSARGFAYDAAPVEDRFEERFAARLMHTPEENLVSLSSWSWRLAPVMTALLFILLAVDMLVGSLRSVDMLNAAADRYEQVHFTKFFTGD